MNENEQEFLHWLPWYVNGTLAPEKREWMDRYLQDHPEAVAELRWDKAFRHLAHRNETQCSPDVGWEKCLQITRKQYPRPRRWIARLKQAIFAVDVGLSRQWRVGIASMAFLVILAESGTIAKLIFDRTALESEVAAYRGSPMSMTDAILQVRFKTGVSEGDMRTLLLHVGGTVVGGPNQLGDYLVSVPKDRLDAANKALVASHLVDIADVVPSTAVGQ